MTAGTEIMAVVSRWRDGPGGNDRFRVVVYGNGKRAVQKYLPDEQLWYELRAYDLTEP